MRRVLIALAVLWSLVGNVFALSANPTTCTTVNQLHSVPVHLYAEAAIFSVTVPTMLPIYYQADGEYIIADDACISNNSSRAIGIKTIELEVAEGWSLIPYSETPDDGMFGMRINDIKSDAEGFLWNDFKVDKGETLKLDYHVTIPEFENGFDCSEIACITFVVTWW